MFESEYRFEYRISCSPNLAIFLAVTKEFAQWVSKNV